MGTVSTLPRGRPLTRDDLAAMPDDGHRYELLDTALLVTPAPSPLTSLPCPICDDSSDDNGREVIRNGGK
jgi:hypothetical protein